jgi:hypothetical protein
MAEYTDNGQDPSEIEGRIKTDAVKDSDGAIETGVRISGDAASLLRQAAAGPTNVRLQRTAAQPTEDQPLWVAIRNRAKAIGFNRYNAFIEAVLCQEPIDLDGSDAPAYGEPSTLDSIRGYGSPTVRRRRRSLNMRSTIHGMDAYKLLKLATEAFLIVECGVAIKDGDLDLGEDDELFEAGEESRRLERSVDLDSLTTELRSYLVGADSSTLPYLDRIVSKLVGFQGGLDQERLPYCQAILAHRLTCPSLIELIWSYWHEEGMLVQTMNAIALRFQNKRRGANDPLANLELDPLRPLNNLIWGFIQDESNRLSVQRRAYEYDHHYGISLVGKAVSDFHPADSRTKFIEAYHNLLYRTVMFYREDDDATMVADAFALLNALREVHIILAEGAHNQFGDLPWKAREEMLMMQWMMARPEIREFIRGRHMAPYQEPWIGAVDDMKRLQGWSDVTATHFHELAVFGEQILLSVRYGDWIEVNDQELARNWARYWRPEIQRYIHAYHAVSGVDLSVEITDTRLAENRYRQPSVLIANRLAVQHPGVPNLSRGKLRAPHQADAELLDIPAHVLRQLPRRR